MSPEAGTIARAGDAPEAAVSRTEMPSEQARVEVSLREWLTSRDWARLAPLVLVAIAIGFNLVVLRQARLWVGNLNDTSVHAAMVRWAERQIQAGHLPFDGWFPVVSAGVAQFHTYQSLAHIITAFAALLFGANQSVTWSLYLLLAFWPLCIYWSARIFGFNRSVAAAAALVSPLLVSFPSYGYDSGSYLWRGWGMWSQLWGMWALPFALALSWRAVAKGKGYAVAALALALTMAFHFLTGYLAMVALGLWVLLSPSEILTRVRRAFVIGAGALLVAAWVLVPLLSDSRYYPQSETLTNSFYTDSWGAQKVVTWLFQGELLDYGRWPVVSLLALVGAGVAVARFRRDERVRALLAFAVLSLVMFSGPKTFGGVLDLLPGSGNLLFHRYIIGVNLVGIYLAGMGAAWLAARLRLVAVSGLNRLDPAVMRLRHAPAVLGAVVMAILVVFLLPAWSERAAFAAQDREWMAGQRAANATDGLDVVALAEEAASLGGGRVYAGLTSNWGYRYRVGSIPVYSILLDHDIPAIGFTYRVGALTIDAESRFDETNPAQYDLFNVRYLLLPSDRKPAVSATLLDRRGRHTLWAVHTTGYLEVIDTVEPAIVMDRTNVGRQTADWMRSSLLAARQFPTIAFDGDRAPAPTVAFGATVSGAPGEILSQSDHLGDGDAGGVVTVKRRAVVMLKASYQPRWHATVDGRPAAIQMVAPAFLGVVVGPGVHRIEFHYEPVSNLTYLCFFLLAGVTLTVLAAGPGWLARARDRRPGGDPSS